MNGRLWFVATFLVPTSAFGQPVLQLEQVVDGLTAPVAAVHAGDGSGRLFVADQSGVVRVVEPGGNLQPEPFLDVRDQLVPLGFFGPDSFDERGLLGLAFHPDFANNGRLYTYHSAPTEVVAADHESVITEYTVSAGNPNQVDPSSARTLFTVPQPQFNHDGGQLAFGPDGFLYASLGDGGRSRDVGQGHSLGIGNGQDRGNVLGSILRIDVDGSDSENGQYGIPDTNPFVGDNSVPSEIYAYGFRNPWRFSFDDGPGGTGRMFVGDVGQNLFEEVDLVESGGNYGWNRKEGSHFFDPDDPTMVPAVGFDVGPHGEPLIDPILEYFNGNNPDIQPGDPNGRAVVAGFVYRGDVLANLVGDFIFGDWSREFGAPDGSLFIAEEDPGNPGVFSMTEALVDFGSGPQRLGLYLLAFGEDEDGELYILTNTSGTPFGATGAVYRLVPEPTTMTLLAVGVLCAGRHLRRRRPSPIVGACCRRHTT